MSRKQIIIVGPGKQHLGGISEYINGIFSSRLAEEYDLLMFDTLQIKQRNRPSKRTGFKFSELTKSIKVIREFNKMLKSYPLADVHIHSSSYWGFYEKLVLLLIAKLKARRVFYHIHGGSFHKFFKQSKLRELLRMILSFSDKIICVSSDIYEIIKLPKKSLVIGNGIFCPADLKYHKSESGITFLSISVLEKRKSIDMILKAVLRLKNDGFSNFEFSFAGDGPAKDELLDFVRENELEHFVKYRGIVRKEEKDRLLRDSQVFISASLYESFGISIAEGMAYGLGIISTAEGIAAECLNNNNGILIEKNSVTSLYNAMLNYLQGNIDLEYQFNYNTRYIRENYSWDIIANKMGKIYGEDE